MHSPSPLVLCPGRLLPGGPVKALQVPFPPVTTQECGLPGTKLHVVGETSSSSGAAGSGLHVFKVHLRRVAVGRQSEDEMGRKMAS
jgi:hypothetical protein